MLNYVRLYGENRKKKNTTLYAYVLSLINMNTNIHNKGSDKWRGYKGECEGWPRETPRKYDAFHVGTRIVWEIL